MLGGHPKGGTLALRIRFNGRDGQKVSRTGQHDVQSLAPWLRAVLSKLRLPHPKTSNVSKRDDAPSTIDVFWDYADVNQTVVMNVISQCEKTDSLTLQEMSIDYLMVYLLPESTREIPSWKFPTVKIISTVNNSTAIASSNSHTPCPASAAIASSNSHPPPPASAVIASSNSLPPRPAFTFIASSSKSHPPRPAFTAIASSSKSHSPRPAFTAIASSSKSHSPRPASAATVSSNSHPPRPASAELEGALLKIFESIGLPIPTPVENIAAHIPALSKYLEVLRSAVDSEARARMKAEAALTEERARHARILQDIQTECREPFVVPALLDAFVAVSQIVDSVSDSRAG